MLASLLLIVLPSEPITLDVDIIEINHVINSMGTEQLVQVIWWDWSVWHGEYKVRDWRLMKDCVRPVMEYGRPVQRWHDGERHMVVRGRAFRETWTPVDVEIKDREKLPECMRRKVGRK